MATIVAALGDILLSTEDVETLDEWLNDQASVVLGRESNGEKGTARTLFNRSLLRPSPSLNLDSTRRNKKKTKKNKNKN